MVHTDINNNHRTTYSKIPRPNPKFNGKTTFEWICEYSRWMIDNYDKTFVWDGDSIEFITQNFYKATVDGVMLELVDTEARFMQEIQSLPKEGIFERYGPLQISETNIPWATHLTNIDNIAMFNNGTLHINATLPTRLNFSCRPMWSRDFVEKHRRLARLIQWVEPLWVALYGSGDPFTKYPELRPKFAAGSQRLAVSRYIGLGTFDTNLMSTGKILQVQKSEIGPIPWYDELYAKTAYEALDVIGLDLNFSKHWAHGLEIRIFDQMPFTDLQAVLEQVVLLMDVSLALKQVPDPRINKMWQKMAADALYEGGEMNVSASQLNELWTAFGIKHTSKEPLIPIEAMNTLVHHLQLYKGFCWDKMINKNEGVSCSRCC